MKIYSKNQPRKVMHMGGELNQNAPFNTMTPQMNKPNQPQQMQPQYKMPMMNMGMRGGGKVNKRNRSTY